MVWFALNASVLNSSQSLSNSSCLSGHGGLMESVYSTTTERLKILCITTATTEQPQHNSRATLANGLHKGGFSDVPQRNSSTPDKSLHRAASQFNSCSGLVQGNKKQIPLKTARRIWKFSNPHLKQTAFAPCGFYHFRTEVIQGENNIEK